MPTCHLAALPLLLAAAAAQTPPAGLAELPAPRSTRALQFSSYDRGGGNEDTGNWLRVEPDGTRVLAELDGPGRVVRIWSANPDADVALELDGEVVHRGPLARLFDQSLPPFVRPLAGRWGGGFVSHVPLPFRERLRFTSPPGPSFYYQIGVELGDEAERFALPPGPAVRRALEALGAGARTRDEGETVYRRDEPVVGRRRLVQREGPGELLELRLRRRGDAAGLWLEVRYDDASEPALAAPVDALFATLPEQLGDQETLRLPMPFRSAFALDLVDRVARDAAAATRVDVEATFRALPRDHGRRYLHARWHRRPTVWGEPFEVLDVQGGGHFVGLVARLRGGSGHGLSFLEGDETITVDGEVAFRGTGTEDWFSGAWYFRSGPFRAPFHALSELDHDRQRVAVARFHIADPIPFRASFRFDLEHGGQNDTPGADYATLAFWYADSPAGRAVDVGVAAEPARVTEVVRAADRWPEHTTAAGEPARPLRTVLPAGRLPMPPDTVVTLLAGGRAVHGPAWLSGDPEAAAIELGAPLEVDAVRLEPILPAIRAWRVVGPFPGGRRAGIDRVFGPERDADPAREYEAIVGDGPRSWRDLQEPPWPSGYVDLNPLFSPADEVVAYAATEVHSPQEQRAVLWIGSDDAVQVFLDGALVHEHRGLRGAARDQDRVEVTLRAGTSRLLVKVEDYFGGFGLFARFEGAAGLTFSAR